MRRQVEVWQEEHITGKTYNRVHGENPSGCVVKFADFLEEQGFKPQNTRVLDLGSGKGRNSIYLARRGFQVTAADFVYKNCLSEARDRARKAQVTLNIREMDFSQSWPFPNEYFGAIVDCNGTICIPNPARESALQQAQMKLQHGGYYLFYGVGPLGNEKPDRLLEPNSLVLDTGQFEKRYTEDELLETYRDFKVVKFDKQKSRDVIQGKETDLTMWLAIFQKP